MLAAAVMRERYLSEWSPNQHHEGIGYGHIVWMLDEIVKGEMPEDKTMRWLGYVQGYLVLARAEKLAGFQALNLEASGGAI